MSSESMPADGQAHLERRLTLLPATALNMANMIGLGPFITIPMLMSALGGPPSMLGWLLGFLIALPDSLIWSELGAALPGSGGTYRWLREGFGRETWGRLMAFLFLWQFLVSGPLEIASGYFAFASYADYLWPGLIRDGRLTPSGGVVVVAVGLFMIFLLYRRITDISRLTVSLWIGVLLTVGALLITGALHFDPAKAFDMPSESWKLSWGLLLGLGTATRVAIYDFLGYYDICFLGDEVRDPGRTIPRSVILSLVAVAVIYVGINLSITGIIPWREFVPPESHAISGQIASHVMERIHGPTLARVFTLMILWTGLGSCFALLLGYSRIPYAAARDGIFFSVFSRVHPTKHFPHLSLVTVGLLSIGASFISLPDLVDGLVTLRIVILFIGQAVALVLLRRRRPDLERPYRVWLYPVPIAVAIAGWSFALVTSRPQLLLLAAGILAAGLVAFLGWSALNRQWPFPSDPRPRNTR